MKYNSLRQKLLCIFQIKEAVNIIKIKYSLIEIFFFICKGSDYVRKTLKRFHISGITKILPISSKNSF